MPSNLSANLDHNGKSGHHAISHAVYGTTLKALIREEFGDVIMSAMNFRMDLSREPDSKGDRVKIVMSGKFLPYRSY